MCLSVGPQVDQSRLTCLLQCYHPTSKTTVIQALSRSTFLPCTGRKPPSVVFHMTSFKPPAADFLKHSSNALYCLLHWVLRWRPPSRRCMIVCVRRQEFNLGFWGRNIRKHYIHHHYSMHEAFFIWSSQTWVDCHIVQKHGLDRWIYGVSCVFVHFRIWQIHSNLSDS